MSTGSSPRIIFDRTTCVQVFCSTPSLIMLEPLHCGLINIDDNVIIIQIKLPNGRSLNGTAGHFSASSSDTVINKKEILVMALHGLILRLCAYHHIRIRRLMTMIDGATVLLPVDMLLLLAALLAGWLDHYHQFNRLYQ